MAYKTIGQLDEASAITVDDYLEIEQGGASKKVSITNIGGSVGMPIGMLFMSEFEETPSSLFPAIPRNIDNDITYADYPSLVTKALAQKSTILGVSDFTGVISSVNTSYSMITFVTSSAVTAMCTLITNDAKVSSWLNTGQNASAAATVDFTTSSTSRCITINSVDYPIYPSTAASAISITAGTIIFEGKPTTGTTIASIYPYRIPGSPTSARFHKLSGLVGVVAGDADGIVVAGFRKMDQEQSHIHRFEFYDGTADSNYFTNRYYARAASDTSTLGKTTGGSFNTTSNGVQYTDGTNGVPRTGKTTDPRSIGQYTYTWAGICNIAP